MAALAHNYSLIEFSDKTSNAQAVSDLHVGKITSLDSHVSPFAKTVNTRGGPCQHMFMSGSKQ